MEITTPAKHSDKLLGHKSVEAMLVRQIEQGNLPHAMLFCGPKGIGKATMAYRLAKFLAIGGSLIPKEPSNALFDDLPPIPSEHSLAVDNNHPAISRIENNSHGDVMTITPQWDERKKAFKNDILVDDVRKVGHFLSLTPSECNYRIVIIDAADELNISSANAILKLLEEPPQNALMILISHQPGKLLPTIRSRCRTLTFVPPSQEQFDEILKLEDDLISEKERQALYILSNGSPGFALALASGEALALYSEQMEASLNPSHEQLQAFASAALSKKYPHRWAHFRHCWFALLNRVMLQRQQVLGGEMYPKEAEQLDALGARLSMDEWMQLWQDSERLFSRTDAVYLDPQLTVQQLFGALSGQAIRI